jgi:ParB-like chromosome segregation protein Spo0J
MASEIVFLPISSIRLDFQDPENLDDERVQYYIAALSGGEVIDPVTVQFDGETYWLRDGFHRLTAAQSLGRKEIEAEIILGTYAEMEAEWNALLEAGRNNLRKWAANRGKDTND